MTITTAIGNDLIHLTPKNIALLLKQSEPGKTNATREKSSLINVSSFSIHEITPPKKIFSQTLDRKRRGCYIG
ncbi:hypothetical protein, partial [Anabaena sp. UHCC 0187]|uniref:hypothetical protein n=1 Tax=Anabaena sp. UHCC 0187 TaxID=2590018 RepID=UPI001C2C3558